MRKIKRHPRIEVWWNDAWSSSSVWDRADLEREPPYIMKTVGFFIFHNKRYIGLGSDLDPQGRFRHVGVIPNKMIIKIFKIK